MSRALFAVVLAFPLIALANPHYRPDVEVIVPPEVFSSGGQSAQPCTQCCVYQDQNYSEGAVIKAEGILLQCQRDDKTLSTNPLVWRRVKPYTPLIMECQQGPADIAAPLQVSTRPAPDVHVPVTSRGSRVRARHEDG